MRVAIKRFMSPVFKLSLLNTLKTGMPLPKAFMLAKVYALARDGREKLMTQEASPAGYPTIEYTATFCEGETVVALRIQFQDQTIEVSPFAEAVVQNGADAVELKLSIDSG